MLWPANFPSPRARTDLPDRLESLEAEVASLRRELQALRDRMETLESRSAPRTNASQRAAAPSPPGSPAQSPTYGVFVQSVAPLAGRMLLFLAGAFVLRALTDAGTLPAAAGVALGFAYAAGVLALSARTGSGAAAGFLGTTAVLLLFPLLHEATARFHLLGAPASAVILLAASAAVLGVAAWRGLHGMAWIGTGASLLTAASLILATGRVVPATLAVVALALATLWVGDRMGWHALRWPPALAADLAVVVALGRSATLDAVEGPPLALLAAAFLVVGYLGSFAARTLRLGRSVGMFEVAQTALLLPCGLGATAFLFSRSEAATTALGLGTLAVAAGAYAVAFVYVERRQSGSANFPFYASVALAFALAGVWLAVPGPARGPALGVLSVAAAALARLFGRRTLPLHAAVYALFAAGAGGLLGHSVTTLFSTPAGWPPAPAGGLALLGLVAVATLLAALAGTRSVWTERAPQLLLDAVVTVSAAGVLAGWAGAALASSGPPDPGALGTARSAVLSACAILVAWIGSREPGLEAGWLAWPIVALLGLKLALEDFPRGRPATLILSLAFAGAALIVVPRLRARAPASAQTASSAPIAER